MAGDFRYALRSLAKQPLFAAIAIFTLALGIGANTAIFSVVDAVLLRPLPFRQPTGLVSLSEYDLRSGPEAFGEGGAISYPDFADWRAQNRVFAGLAVYGNNSLTLTDGRAAAAHITGLAVSAELFSVLGVQPAIGRTFRTEEDEPGQHVAILGYGLYQQRFNGDPTVVGKSVNLDGRTFQVVGVMPPGFNFPVQSTAIDLYTTVASLRESSDGDQPMTEQRGNDFLSCIARLKQGVSLGQAQANIDTIGAALQKQYPDTNAHVGVKVLSLMDVVAGRARSGLIMLCAMAACVLLGACVNVANLLLARALARQREINIRAALGAGRMQIVRQLLVESALLSIVGGAVGFLCAIWGVDLLKSFLPSNVPRIDQISPDRAVLLFTAGVSILVGLFAGLLPAWRASSPALISALNESSRGSTEAGGGRRIRALLVVVEIVLAVVLLASAGLLVQSFIRLQRVTPGFDPTNVMTARIALPNAGYGKPEQVVEFVKKLKSRLAELPGVSSASVAWWLPLTGSEITFNLAIEGRPVPKAERPVVQVNAVGVDYFKTLRVPVVRGRDFNPRDDFKAPAVAIVTESFARQFFPGEDPIGKRITPAGSVIPGEPPVREIVGVAGDSRALSLQEEPKPEVFVPHAQFPVQSMAVLVRSQITPQATAAAMRNVVNELDQDVPLFRPRSMPEFFSASVAQPRFHAVLVSLFSAVALLLAAAGIFGVMSYTVTQRTQEIGIRLALGAQRSDVLRLILSHGLQLVAIGIALGVAIMIGMGRILHSLLYGIGSTDVLNLIVVAVLLGAVASVACWWPAQRASHLDPMAALRDQ